MTYSGPSSSKKKDRGNKMDPKNSNNFLDEILLAVAFLTFGVYDSASSLAAAKYLGTFEYEANPVCRYLFSISPDYFMMIKCMTVVIGLSCLYLTIKNIDSLRSPGRCLMMYIAIAGAFVSLSNLNIIISDQSIFIFGLDSGIISTIIIFTGVLSAGLLYYVDQILNKKQVIRG
jgi:hypothetical protein